MSLLDNVSIVVTPNAYKASKLYAVLPTYAEGNELITNGDFDTDSDWGKGTGWSINTTSKIAECDGSQTANTNLYPTVAPSLVNNQTYLLSLDVTLSAGTLSVFAFSSGVVLSKSSTGTSTLTLYFTKGTGGNLYIQGNADFIGSVDNVSIKEVTSSDMDVTRATAATRVDENGLVNYAEVLGSEEVSCGDFACADPNAEWITESGWSFSGGNANRTNTGTFTALQQNILESGKTYKVTFTISAITSGEIFGIRLGSNYILRNSSEAKTYIGYGDANGTTLSIMGNQTFAGSVSSISVKEVDLNNVPRIDYTGGGCPHILAEPQRTNLFTYSEDFSSWSNDNSTDTPNSTTAPDGTLTATEVTEDTATGRHGVFYNIGSQTGTEFSFSAFVKDNNRRYVSIVLSDIATWNSMVVFDLTTGTITKEYTKTGYTGTSSITAIGNGWYRISNTLTGLAFTGSTVYSRIYLQDTPTPANPPSNTYTGDGTSSIYIWGAQLEASSYPTSYIPTSGSTVTRNQDVFSRDGIGSLINDSEGVLFVEIASLIGDEAVGQLSISNGTSSEAVKILWLSANSIRLEMNTASGTDFFKDVTVTRNGGFDKLAIQYKSNNYKIYFNGSAQTVTQTAAIPSGLNKLSLDRGDGGSKFFGKVKQLQVYDTALTDMQLIQLTGTAGTDFYESYAEMASALTYTIQ